MSNTKHELCARQIKGHLRMDRPPIEMTLYKMHCFSSKANVLYSLSCLLRLYTFLGEL